LPQAFWELPSPINLPRVGPAKPAATQAPAAAAAAIDLKGGALQEVSLSENVRKSH